MKKFIIHSTIFAIALSASQVFGQTPTATATPTTAQGPENRVLSDTGKLVGFASDTLDELNLPSGQKSNIEAGLLEIAIPNNALSSALYNSALPLQGQTQEDAVVAAESFGKLSAALLVVNSSLIQGNPPLPESIQKFTNDAYKKIDKINSGNLPLLVNLISNVANYVNNDETQWLFKDANAASTNFLVKYANDNLDLKNNKAAQAIAGISIKVLSSSEKGDNYDQALLNLQKTQSIAQKNGFAIKIPEEYQNQLKNLPAVSQGSTIISPGKSNAPVPESSSGGKGSNNPIRMN
jgi:hypothetical protein